ncbi:MAG: c-type cytochrome [Desulfobulbaceae bacterium]|jgi:nitric oxide reductase subunit C|nr:c-type cytochrome [Desulfobulbaceae bacterium]MDY0351188.1 c-type cytochrome [Desulfobulbaceae bacterium]
MTLRNARIIFWAGTLVSVAIFAWLTWDFHRQEEAYAHTSKIDDRVVAGKKVWHKYNCNNCHTILGFGGYYAPDMTKAYYRLGESNIISIVMQPQEIYRDSFRKMPNLGVTEAEAADLVQFLHWTANIENRKWPPQDEKYVQAARLRDEQPEKVRKTDIVLGACGGCHSFANQGRDIAGDFGELARDLDYDRETLVRFMLDPRSVNSDSSMPAQNITPETAGIIADFILSLR